MQQIKGYRDTRYEEDSNPYKDVGLQVEIDPDGFLHLHGTDAQISLFVTNAASVVGIIKPVSFCIDIPSDIINSLFENSKTKELFLKVDRNRSISLYSSEKKKLVTLHEPLIEIYEWPSDVPAWIQKVFSVCMSFDLFKKSRKSGNDWIRFENKVAGDDSISCPKYMSFSESVKD